MKRELMGPPAADEHHEYYSTYIRLVPQGELSAFMKEQIADFRSVLDNVSSDEAVRLHDPYTWTIKQVVGHLIDCERIFGNRLHRFASGDDKPLPGMDQNPYVANNDYDSPALASLVDELEYCRRANVLLLQRIKPESWNNRGLADGNPITVRALAYILAGHIIYHMKIVRKRLGLNDEI